MKTRLRSKPGFGAQLIVREVGGMRAKSPCPSTLSRRFPQRQQQHRGWVVEGSGGGNVSAFSPNHRGAARALR